MNRNFYSNDLMVTIRMDERMAELKHIARRRRSSRAM